MMKCQFFWLKTIYKTNKFLMDFKQHGLFQKNEYKKIGRYF